MMNPNLCALLLAGAALAGACSHDKPAAEQAASQPTPHTAAVISNRDTAAYFARARGLAQRVEQDLSLPHTIVITRLVPVFVERERALADLDAQADTTGRAAARRAADEAATRGVQGALTDPAQQRAYAERQNSYYSSSGAASTGANAAAGAGAAASASTDTAATATAPEPKEGTPTAAARPARRAHRGQGSGIVEYEKRADGELKIKYANGAKVKVSPNGDRKIVGPRPAHKE